MYEPLRQKNRTQAPPTGAGACWLLLGIIVVGAVFAVGIVIGRGTADLQRADNGNQAAALSAPLMPASAERASPVPCPHAVGNVLPRTLVAMGQRIRAHAAAQPELTWPEYEALIGDAGADNAELLPPRRVVLRTGDFASGTLRIRSSGVFRLGEDVLVDSNAAHDYRPDLPRQAALYGGAAYTLGFFAAITVEARDVVIDLDGHTLAQTPLYAQEQRFFALIELDDKPFISGQGPANFGPTAGLVNGLVIENGVLGRSSHHGLHGNGGTQVLLQNLRFREYEVAAIALNGFSDVVIRNVHAEGSFTRVPVLGTYSNARFLVPFARRALQHATLAGDKKAAIREALGPLQRLMAEMRSAMAHGTRPSDEALALFGNPSGLCDGNAYALTLHPLGAAVNGFWHAATPRGRAAGAMERVLLENCTFAGTRINVIEVVALVAPNGQPVRGPAGDILRVTDNSGNASVGGWLVAGDKTTTTTTATRPLNALARAHAALLDAALSISDASERKAVFGTVNGDAHAVAWLKLALVGGVGVASDAALARLVRDHGYRYERNGDTMFHVNKGVVGVRLDGASDVCLRGVRVLDTSNVGRAGTPAGTLPGENSAVTGATALPPHFHPAQGPQPGYMGADSRGISAAGTSGLYLHNVSVDGVASAAGNAHGIDLFNGANNTYVSTGCAAAAVLGGNMETAGVRASRVAATTAYGLAAVAVHNVSVTSADNGVTMRLGCSLVLGADGEPAPLETNAAANAINVYGF